MIESAFSEMHDSILRNIGSDNVASIAEQPHRPDCYQQE
jgi:hypothetical protein